MKVKSIISGVLAAALLLGSASGAPLKKAKAADEFDHQPVPSVKVEKNVDFKDCDADYQVTFSYENTTGKEVKSVTLNGTFQFYDANAKIVSEWSKIPGNVFFGAVGELPMTDAFGYKTGYQVEPWNMAGADYKLKEVSKDHFEITLPLPGFVYEYMYTIEYADGTKDEMVEDPKNPSEKNPNRKGPFAAKSVVLVGNAKTAINDHGVCFPRADKKGTYSYVEYSCVDGTTQPLAVYLPYGYDESKVYPTIYASHGGGGDETDWIGMGLLPNIMDNLIAEGKVPACVVVVMNHTYFNWDYDKIAKNFEKWLFPYMEKHYSVSKSYKDRALCGLSMGSMTTNTMMLEHTKLFDYYGCFSGGNGSSKVKDLEALKAVSGIYITAGELDMAYMGDSYHTDNDITTIGFEERLDELGINYTKDVKHGLHDWSCWRNALATFVRDTAFEGNVAKGTVKSVTAGKGSVKIKAAQVAVADKYQFAYRVKGTKTWKYASSKNATKTIKGLESGKTYEVAVRAVSGNNKGKFSAKKTVKVK
ncbi:MAG: fibronectin type III domain-containing protein [Lachnospiraceae bacterium]|nr:fibronectin type III domain-containing protein [Lachnospiraceae bacterium]